jgi:hypothetical protein
MSYKVCIALAVVVVVIVSLVCCCCYWFAGKKEGFSALADQNLFAKIKLGGRYQNLYVKNRPDGPPVRVTLAHKGVVDVPDMFSPYHKIVKCSKYAIQFTELNNGKYTDKGFVKIVDNKIVLDTNRKNHTIFTFYPVKHPYDKTGSQAYIIFTSTNGDDFYKLINVKVKGGGTIPVLEITERGTLKISTFKWNTNFLNTISETNNKQLKTEQLFGIEKGR